MYIFSKSLIEGVLMQASTSKSLESLRSHERRCTSVVCVIKRCSSQGAVLNHCKPIQINIKYKKMEIRRVGQSPLCLPHVNILNYQGQS